MAWLGETAMTDTTMHKSATASLYRQRYFNRIRQSYELATFDDNRWLHSFLTVPLHEYVNSLYIGVDHGNLIKAAFGVDHGSHKFLAYVYSGAALVTAAIPDGTVHSLIPSARGLATIFSQLLPDDRIAIHDYTGYVRDLVSTFAAVEYAAPFCPCQQHSLTSEPAGHYAVSSRGRSVAVIAKSQFGLPIEITNSRPADLYLTAMRFNTVCAVVSAKEDSSRSCYLVNIVAGTDGFPLSISGVKNVVPVSTTSRKTELIQANFKVDLNPKSLQGLILYMAMTDPRIKHLHLTSSDGGVDRGPGVYISDQDWAYISVRDYALVARGSGARTVILATVRTYELLGVPRAEEIALRIDKRTGRAFEIVVNGRTHLLNGRAES